MTVTSLRSLRRLVPALSVVALLPLAACTGADSAATDGTSSAVFYGDTSGTTLAAMTPTTSLATDRGRETAGSDDGIGEVRITPISAQTPSDFGREIIFTADLTVAVPDVAAAGAEAIRRVEALGGIVYGQQTTSSPDPVSILTFKVFPEDFQTAFQRLGDIGEVRSQNVSADDVTERVVTSGAG